MTIRNCMHLFQGEVADWIPAKSPIFFGRAAALALSAASALAAPPANDAFATRQVLASAASVTVNGTTVDATQEPLEPIYRAEGDSVWYQWTAPSTGVFKLEATAGAGDPPSIGVLQGAALDTLELLAPDGELPVVHFAATAGQVYFFHLAAGEYIDNGPFTLTLAASAFPTAPANDNFSAATVITGTLPRTVNSTLAAATMEAREPRPDIEAEFNPQRSVWYTWTPTTAGWTSIYPSGSQIVNIYTGSGVTALTELARGDVYGEARFAAVAGTTYRIQVLSDFERGAGPFVLTVMRPTDPQPAGDNFASRISLGNASSVTRTDSTVGARIEAGEKLPGDARSTIWYAWMAPATGAYAIEVYSPDFYPVASVYSGTVLASLSLLAKSVYNFTTDSDLLVFKATAGQIYQIQAGSWGWGEGDLDFALRPATAADVNDHPLLTSLTATPSTVNLGAAGGSFAAEAKASVDDSPRLNLVAFSFPLWRQAGSGGPSRQIFGTLTDLTYADELTTGNLTEYRFAETVELPASLPPGDYGIFLSQSSGGGSFGPNSGNPADPLYPSYADPVPGGGRITITNAAVDALPVLSQFTATPTSVNVTSGSQQVNFTGQATDDFGVADSGVNVAVHDATMRLAGFMDMGSSGIAHLQRTAGTATNGTYTGSIQIPRYSRPGTYFLTPTVEDERDGLFGGFGRDYGYCNPFGAALPAGATASIIVVNNGPVDIMPPQWLTTDFEPQNVDVRAGAQAVKLRVRLRDGLSGVSSVYGNLYASTVGFLGFFTLVNSSISTPPISGNANDGVWETTFIVDRTPDSGPAQLFASLADNVGNYGDLNDGRPGPIGPQNEVLNVIGGGPANPAESAWSATALPGFPWDETTALNRDKDGDALPNAVEFHLGTDPTDPANAANPTAVPVVTAAGASLRIEFSLSATNPLLGDGAVTRLVGQWSADMASWTTVVPTSLGSGRFRVEVPAVSGKVYARLAVVPIP